MDRIDGEIESFFSWYKRRLANVAALGDVAAPNAPGARAGSFLPEQHVLIGCGIEALSSAWAEVFRPDLTSPPAARRWSEFLQENANSSGIFDRVAAPMLADDIESKGNAEAAETIRVLARDTDDERGGHVRHWDDDPKYLQFVSDPRVAALTINAQLARFRYGEVLYREYRCQWSHRVYASEKLAPSNHDEQIGWDAETSVRVRYQNYGVRPHRSEPGRLVASIRRPLFTFRWLLTLYEESIASFERRCVGEHRSPMPI